MLKILPQAKSCRPHEMRPATGTGLQHQLPGVWQRPPQQLVQPLHCDATKYTLNIRAEREPGSSPRVRGTGRWPQRGSMSERFIPACAGNSAGLDNAPLDYPVHPRVCGEQRCWSVCAESGGGSSPRVRGTGMSGRSISSAGRFIPACAGNSFLALLRLPRQAVHPRVCGEQGLP